MEPVVSGGFPAESMDAAADVLYAKPEAATASPRGSQEQRNGENEQHALQRFATSSRLATTLGTFSLADFSEIFRLYLGTNIIMFPYVLFLAGAVGGVVLLAVCLILIYGASQHMLRAKKLVMGTTRVADEGPAQSSDEAGSGNDARNALAGALPYPPHDSLRTYVGIAEGCFAPMRKQRGGEAAAATAAEPFLLVFVRWMMVICQFIWGASLTMNLGANIAGLCSLSQRAGYLTSMLLLTGMLTTYHAGTSFFYAHMNNVALLSSACIVLYSIATTAAAAGGGTPATQMALWLWPRSIADMWIGICIGIAYTSGLVFVPDCEASTSLRYCKEKGFDARVSTAPRTRHLIRRFEGYLAVCSAVAVLLLVLFAQAVFATYREQTNAVVALSLPEGPTRTLLFAVLSIGIAFCASINTAAICNIADDSAGVQCLLDRVFAPRPVPSASSSGGEASFSWGRRVVIRLAIFSSMQLFIAIVPFFDLVVSLSGSIGLSTMTFLIPPMLELQGHRRTVALRRAKVALRRYPVAGNMHTAEADTCGADEADADWTAVGWCEAFGEIPTWWGKTVLVVIVGVGMATLLSGTYTAVMENVKRLS